MVTGLSVVLLIVDAAMILLAAYYLVLERLLDDRLLLLGAILEVGLVVQLVLGLVKLTGAHGRVSAPIFVAYLLAILLVVPGAILLALKEKTRWGMVIVISGGLIVGVLVARLQQIWAVGG